VIAGATYVYCIVSSSQPLQTTNPTKIPGPPGTGPVRALEVRPGKYLMVSTAPLAQFGEAPLSAKLSDLEWVSSAAVAHDAVTESFMRADAVVPMKLFTLFTSDDRALEQIRAGWTRVDAAIRRLTRHDEWVVRLVFDEARAPKEDLNLAAASGRGYLLAKRQHRAATTKHSAAMRKIAGDVLKALRPVAKDIHQRAVTTPEEGRSRLLLDAAFLVPRAKANRFKRLVEARAKKIAPGGYALQATGPWPPYSFVEKG
jgi:hypothetical protein